MVPIFPELRPHLLEAFEQAEPGTEHVIARRLASNANLRTKLHRIIRKAGLVPWPRTFHNLRATRQTELAERFPGHVVCAWIGNSERVAQNHYLQVTDAHLALAVKEPAEKAAQNPAHATAETTGTDGKSSDDTNEKTPVFPGLSVAFHSTHNQKAVVQGLALITRAEIVLARLFRCANW
jgi:hypothetical protein